MPSRLKLKPTMKVKDLAIIFISSFFLTFILAPLRGFISVQIDSLAGFTGFFILTIFFLRKYQSAIPMLAIVITIFLGRWIIELPLRFIDFNAMLGSLPGSIIQTLGIFCGFLYWRLKKPLNYLAFLLCFSVTIFMFFKGYDMWLHKLNFGSFTGKVVSYNLPAKFEAFDEQKHLITDNNFQNKIVLLDFWNTRCGVCFEKFPQLQSVYEKYQADLSVAIFAVNKPIEEDKPNQAFEMIRKEGYSFPVVITKEENLAEKLDVKGYPTTFVINKSGMVVYKGDLEGAIRLVDDLNKQSK